MLDRMFWCSAEGKRAKDKRDDYVRTHRPETRFGCLANMQVNSRKTGKFCITKFVPEHKHYLSTLNKTHLHRSHRKITVAHAGEIDMANSVWAYLQKQLMTSWFNKQEDGRIWDSIFEDYRNYLHSKRTRDMKVRDTGGVLEYLQRSQVEDPNFFYAIQVDEDDLITNIFWADAKMRADYVKFRDVVCFDTTYRKNNEGRPFALFIGVNHHKQTTIFGAALLYDETSQTFEWLFDTFVRTMFGRKPNTILIDQDAAMAKALTSKWPKTCHRLCIWHIYQNAANYLSYVFEKYKSFARNFRKCIYDFDKEDDFVKAWNEMLDTYGQASFICNNSNNNLNNW